MILEFSLKNYLSYKDEASICLLAPSNKVKNRYQDNYTNVAGYDVLKNIVIVGENAGGKSNFVKGIQYFKGLFSITDKVIKSNYTDVFNNYLQLNLDKSEYYKNEDLSNLNQMFRIKLVNSKDVVYEYELIIDGDGIKDEKLSYSNGKGKQFKNIFTYSNNNIIKLSIPQNEKIESILQSRINDLSTRGLIISSLSLLGIEYIDGFIDEINNIYIDKKYLDIPTNIQFLVDKKNFNDDLYVTEKKEFLEIFKLIDSSILGIKIDKETPFNSIIIRKNTNGDEIKRSIFFESTGIKDFFKMAIDIYKVIYENKVFISDELDSTFNAVIMNKVLSYINSFNTRGQFIFTTHNIFNLTFKQFMKEQMYIVSKDKDTLESTIYSLATFDDIRYDSNNCIYEYYLKGVLGGVDNG